MIEGIVQLGEIVRAKSDYLGSLIQNVSATTKKGEKRYVCKFIFNTKAKTLELDLNEEVSSNTAKKYLHIGSADGPNAPQWYCSSSTPGYFLTETVPNLTEKSFGDEMDQKIKLVLQDFFIKIDGVDKKYRYFLDLRKIGVDFDLKNIFENEKIKNEKQKNKEVQKEVRNRVQKLFNDFIKEKYALKSENIGLYILVIDNTILCSLDIYKDLILSGKTKEKNESKGKKQTVPCGLCGSNDDIDTDLSQMKIKYYTTDKITFASENNKKLYFKSFALCGRCYEMLQSGESYLKQNLKTKLAIFDIYVVPHFIFGNKVNVDTLNKISINLVKAFNSLCGLEEMEDFRAELSNYFDDKDYYLLNIVFYEAANQATKIKKIIKDVDPSIFEEVGEALYKTGIQFSKYISGLNYNKEFNLKSLLSILPIKQGQKGYSGPIKQLLEWYAAIFSKRGIQKDNIITYGLERCRTEFIKNKTGDGFYSVIIKMNMAINFFEELGILQNKIKGGISMQQLSIKPALMEFIEGAHYDDEKAGLFLLGAIMAEVGYAQSKRGGKKVILNKLNFSGMEKSKIMYLANTLFSKLIQEKILDYNELIYADCMRMLSESKWRLNKKENIFYILTGYSVATSLNIKEAIEKKAAKSNEANTQVIENKQ